MKSLQQWLHELPDLLRTVPKGEAYTSAAQDIQFGPVIMSLYVRQMDIETKRNRVCVAIESIHVDEDEQQQGWFKRVVTLMAVMSPVDYIWLDGVYHGNLLKVLQHHGWTWISRGAGAPSLFRSPRDILGLGPRGFTGV